MQPIQTCYKTNESMAKKLVMLMVYSVAINQKLKKNNYTWPQQTLE